MEKIALVTGASRGIGLAIAEVLAAQGIRVIATSTSESGAKAISAHLSTAVLPGKGVVLDVRDAAAIEALVKSIVEEFGTVNVLVNNAAITDDNIFLRMKPEQWANVIDTDLNSVYRTTKACMRSMLKARFGRVVNITSVVGAMGNPGQANYCAAKAGIIGFTKSIAQEMAAYGITANCIAPGFIDTDMTKGLTETQKQAILGAVPMKKMGEPLDIAHAVAFLVSDYAKYMTGQTLHINGGMYMI